MYVRVCMCTATCVCVRASFKGKVGGGDPLGHPPSFEKPSPPLNFSKSVTDKGHRCTVAPLI